MEVWVLRCGLVWRGEPLHHLAMVPLPFQGRLWKWEGLSVEVGVVLGGGTPPPPAAVPLP